MNVGLSLLVQWGKESSVFVIPYLTIGQDLNLSIFDFERSDFPYIIQHPTCTISGQYVMVMVVNLVKAGKCICRFAKFTYIILYYCIYISLYVHDYLIIKL